MRLSPAEPSLPEKYLDSAQKKLLIYPDQSRAEIVYNI